MWILLITLEVLYLEEFSSTKAGNWRYDINIYTDIVLSFILSFVFLVYGIMMAYKRYSGDFSDPHRLRHAFKNLSYGLGFSILFFLRVIMFAYRPVTNGFMNASVFLILAYYIPEIIPSLLQLYIIETYKVESELTTRVISDIYEEIDSSQV